jgi:hypothetical protein
MAAGIQRFYRRLRYGQPIIVVSGLPRSGTSMLMKMLDAAGIELVVDGIRTADEDNPKGYFELERVKDLHQDEDRTWLRGGRGKAIKIVSYFLRHLPAENNYKVLFLDRDLREVLASQTKMLERRGEQSDTSDEKMIELYEDHLWKVRYQLRHYPQFESLTISHRDVISGPAEQAARIAEFLGGGLPVDKMASVVDSRLYRNRAEEIAS